MLLNIAKGLLLWGILTFFWACQQPAPITPTLFSLVPAEHTGVYFQNNLTYTEEFNAYTYRNFYNGGGVGIGDINNDGLPDLFFCGNMVPNKLYLNKGNLQFEDITDEAGVASTGVWSTGVSLADINGDGYLDIYVCKSGDPNGQNRHNELFINNGDLTFSEQSKAYGIADKGLSSHAAFFDYDKDGDLDCYLLNNSFRSVGGYDLIKDQREIRDTLGGNKLYRNDGQYFTDVSAEAGIYGSVIGFGLGVTVGDINRDSWPDIYVSNDFFERDYLYINQHDGTFKESLEQQMPEISLSAMGADMADLNNDGLPEVFVTDMLPQDDARMKTTTTFENWAKYQLNVKNGYHHQFTRNTLQLNLGGSKFSEIGRLSGTYATDWSWGALIADLDNDGLKDIFVANGIYKDLTDQDYINFLADPATIRAILRRENAVIKQLIDSIPSHRIANYAFANNGDLTFTNKAQLWGLGTPSHSNGSAYADLDNDGDLDLVVNNVNMPSFIYENHTNEQLDRHYLQIKLAGAESNPFGLGTQITLWAQGQQFYQELIPTRGFQSTVDHLIHFGLGDLQQVDSLMAVWPDGKASKQYQISADQRITLNQGQAQLVSTQPPPAAGTLLQEVTNRWAIPYRHRENNYSDFDRDQLVYHMLSNQGPCLCSGDLNGDGEDDLYAGGARDQAGKLLIYTNNGFEPLAQASLTADGKSEDVDCAIFDADGDGDNDLYVASGSSEFSNTSSSLRDRLYINQGSGKFIKSTQLLPTSKFEYSSCVRPFDIDQDGDLDLFVGIRSRPGYYGVPTSGYLLQNDGSGNFHDVSNSWAPQLKDIGMITDAQWYDFEKDGDGDLVLVGDWMAPLLLVQDQGKFQTQTTGLPSGFWNTVALSDLNGDGNEDLVLGNHGLNSRLKASDSTAITMVINDFDGNGQAEQIISVFNGENSYPLALRHDLIKQIPELKKKYLRYQSYKEQRVEDIFSVEQLQSALKLAVTETRSSIALFDSDGFKLLPLPQAAQLAPVYGILVTDINADGVEDLVLGGNFTKAKPEVGIYAGSYGLVLIGLGNGQFEALNPQNSGFLIPGETRKIIQLKSKRNLIVVAKNNDSLQVFTY